MSTATRGPTSGGELIDPPRPNATIRVITGRVAVTRLYDLAYEADLSMIEREASPSAVRGGAAPLPCPAGRSRSD